MESCAICGKEITHYTQPNEPHVTCAKCGSTFCDQHMNEPQCPKCGYKGY